jgi:plastocyanin
MIRRLSLAALCSLAAALVPAVAASADVQTIKYQFGPIEIAPGQNTIEVEPNELRPKVPGYITAFRPDLTYLDGKVPGVDVVHLHHGVWLVDFYPTFAAGEEKTQVELPAGYGFRYDPGQKWLMNYMIHNLTPTPTKVYLTYELDFIPDGDPAAQGIKPVRTQWMDVEGLKVYPVFDALRRGGKHGKFTYPTDVPNAYAGLPSRRNEHVVQEDGTLVYTAGHLHPGGLHTDLYLTRDGRTTRIFRSDAHYFEPAGAVSWDVAMMNTPPDWRVQVRKGDTLSVTGTYDTRKASWYESMAIMPVAFSPGDTTGVDPFSGKLNMTGVLNHGHLAENDNHGGGAYGLPDARAMVSGVSASGGTVTIKDFLYTRGDLSTPGRKGRPPVVRQGRSITFKNLDDRDEIWHTITACKAPCNRSTGIAYPLADGQVDFDSGELGTGPVARADATAQRITWKTPRNLSPGTYTYFCRVHPFMRGAFRVKRR